MTIPITSFRILIALALMMVFDHSSAKPKYAWYSSGSSVTRTAAEEFLKSDHNVKEFTRISIKVDIQISGDQVVENIRSIWFYPNKTEIDSDGIDYIYWDQQIESLIIKEAGVVGPTGRYQRLDSGNVRIIDDEAYNIFTDTKKVILPYSGLSEGDASVLEYEIRYPISKLESNWSYSLHLNTNHPTINFELQAQSDSIDLSWSQVGTGVECQGSRNTLRCTGENVPAYEGDSNILWRDIVDYVHISSRSTWESIIDESLDAFNKAELDSPEVDRLFNRLVNEENSTLEKIDKIHSYVARDIRYLSLSELGHRVTPHTVAFVDKNRFGDCKDKTAVAIALLRKLGLEAYPVLVATTRRNPSVLKTPSAGFFNHMIACFEFEGRRYCLDATDTDTHWSSISSWVQGRVILPLKADGEPTRLFDGTARWKFSSSTDIAFDAEARLIEKQSRTYYTSYAGDLRSSLRSKAKDKRQKTMLDQYHNNVSDSVDPEFDFKKVDSLSPNLEVHSTVEYPKFLETDLDLDYTERDHWLRYELINSKLKTEHSDTEFDGLEIETKYEFDVSAFWNLTRLPPSLNIKGRFGELIRKVSLEDNDKLLVISNTRIPRQEITKDQIEAFNKYLDLLTTESSMNMQGKLKVKPTE